MRRGKLQIWLCAQQQQQQQAWLRLQSEHIWPWLCFISLSFPNTCYINSPSRFLALAGSKPGATQKNTCLTGIMTWVGLCMPKLKADVISWCNNGNNTSAKRPRMRVKKASGQHNPNSNDLKRATRATFKQRISFWNRSCWSQKTDTSCITLWRITLWRILASPYNVNNT